MSIPTVVAGTPSFNFVDTVVTWPTHASGNLGLLFVETGLGETAVIASPAGWTQLPCSPIDQSTITRLTVYYKVAASGAEGNVTITDPGDHCGAVILVVSTQDATNPFNAIAGMSNSGNTTLGMMPAVYTSVADCLVIQGFAWALDSAGPISSLETNSSLGSLTELIDAGTTFVNGGGLCLFSGTKAVAGTVTPTTTTITSTSFASITIAIQPTQAAAGGSGMGRILVNGGSF